MIKVVPRTLSGFMELLPSEQILFNNLQDKIRESYEKNGFLPLDTPIIEDANVLLAKAGGETEKQIYRFTKGETDLALRFDLTVPLAKYVSANYNNLVFPFKRYQIGKVYRGERAQRGRFREFYQCDIDIIGNETLSLLNDALIPNVIYDIFKSLNLGNFEIRLNNRKILNGLFEALNITDKTNTLRILDKIDKISKEEFTKELLDLSISKDNINKIIEFINITGSNKEIITKLYNITNNEIYTLGVKELEEVINYLNDLDIEEKYYKIDLKIARGLDYYTGTVYETFLTDYKDIGSVCSGGRYDNLAEYYTDKKLPGVGISIGLTRLFYQLREQNIITPSSNSIAEVLVLPMSNNIKYSMKVARLLRNNNIKTDVSSTDGSFKQKLNYANRLKIKFVIIIGTDEEEKNIVSIKNMDTGVQEEINYNEIVNYFRNIKKS